MVTCTPTKKAHIWCAHNAGQKFGEIANFLQLNESVVLQNYWKFSKQGPKPDFHTKPPIPRHPRALTPHAECCAEHAIGSRDSRDATDVQRKLFPDLSAPTIRQMFVRRGLHGCVRWRKPWLSKKHVRNQKLWATQYHHHCDFFWCKVWYSDESKFNLFGPNGKSYCRRRVGEVLLVGM